MKAPRQVAALSLAAMLLTLPGCAQRTTVQQPAAAAAGDKSQASTAKLPQQPAPLLPAYVMTGGARSWGYIDATGKFVIPPQFQHADPFGTDGLAAVQQDGHAGLIDRQGKVVLPATYSFIGQLSSGVRIAEADKNHAVVDSQGQILFQSTEWFGDFHEGLAVFTRGKQSGYIHTDGSVAIEPQYLDAHAFQNGLAVVKLQEGEYGIIDPTGGRLGTLSAAYVADPSEGLLAYLDKATRKYGYASSTGDLVIPPQFTSAGAFVDGYAIVNTSSGATAQMRLIDRQGLPVTPTAYASLSRLDGDLYAAGQEEAGYVSSSYTHKALITRDGRQLTDFLYYSITRVAPGILCVTDEHETFLIDDTGARIGSLPSFPGAGTIRFVGDLLQAEIDGDLSYLTKTGKTVWQTDPSVSLAGGGSVLRQKYRPDHFTLIRYPVLNGLPEQQVQSRINDALRVHFFEAIKGRSPTTPPKDDLAIGYTVTQLHNLLVVQLSSSDYPMGAAHGMPGGASYHFDLTTGAEYGLTDLFKPGADYAPRLQSLVSSQIAARSTETWFEKNPAILAKQRFTIQADGLQLWFYPYEIAPYVAGFPSFLIPYNQIADLINTDGALWKAFH
ncbi:MAG: WG repeat-containing protein [Mycobacterium leprae]